MAQWNNLEGNQASITILHTYNLHLNNINESSVKVIKRSLKFLPGQNNQLCF